MTERLSDVTARIGSVRQLSAVISAMRGIAAARSREARSQLDGIRAYARAIADAIGHALALLPESARSEHLQQRAEGHAIIALCAEQGFAGTFNERVLEAVQPLMQGGSRGSPVELLLVGDRGLMVAEERGLVCDWSASMIAHVGEAAPLASRIVEELYRRLGTGRVTRISVIHAIPGSSATIDVAEKVLVPFDFGRFPIPRGAAVPLITLPPAVLLARLAEEYVFAEVCEAVMLSFAAENEARMRAMIAARTNVATTLDDLVARSRQLRQEEITNEIIELASGASDTVR
ncbi:FoF1 ATP synthase subunit gamma [Mesorhizobium sp. BAC0120]|uniref:F0F1 ATP synthase subunit gamma n=1 Tax=Mesorhizobium sp. BAC0120 TaxID=3090670 RepID=UPI00298CBAD9|nr:FoF1 ATP synthase subunit gamma [Mesorhizobium sp. BAC0120]MDW6024399.1 FoF1 ATP synthase subunit gamma [Mesorhizobium sp. BAC0120]